MSGDPFEIEMDLFGEVLKNFQDFDPAKFIENNLTIDGDDFKILGNGWQFMVDIYRYIALQATKPDGKPVVMKKGRQVGGTVMAAALDLYFTNSGMFTKPAPRVVHLFPIGPQAKKFSQDKLEGFIRTAKGDIINKNKLNSPNAVDNLAMKQFETGTLWIDSVGLDADRIRGMTVDIAFYDECFPYDQHIQVEGGVMKIGEIYSLFESDDDVPRARSFNIISGKFEYKEIIRAWSRGVRDLILFEAGGIPIRCTPDHKILTSRGWVQAKNLTVDDFIISSDNDDIDDCTLTQVDGIAIVVDEEEVFDISIEDNHNFIITSPDQSLNSIGLVASNCQDMPQLALGNAGKILTAAKYGKVGSGVQVFFGTPKGRNSAFYKIWESSDKRYYHLGCESCNETFPFYLPGDERWKKIWVEGYTIQCPLCNHKQDKKKALDLGRWVASGTSTSKYVGFHLNQLYIPYFTKEAIMELHPDNNALQNDRLWNNEVLGEFYSGSGIPLTKDDIIENCMDKDRAFARKIDPNKKITYMGVDWGGKADADGEVGGQSYSCTAVLSALPDGTLLLEHAHKLRKTSFDYKKETIREIYRRFGIKRGVSDFYYGQDVVSDLQIIYKDRFLGAQGSGRLGKSMSFRPDELMISYNKDLLIEEIFDLFKKGKIRFPRRSYEQLEWLIEHCTSMDVKQKIVNGQPMKTYIKGSTPNDGLMAILYAYMAYKFDYTSGFTVKPGITQQITMPTPVLAKIKL